MATNINPGELESSFGLTDMELKAAMQLFLLSESSGTAEDKISCSSFSATSSHRSVNNARQVPYHFAPSSFPAAEEGDEADDDDDGPWRPDKRYRPVSDLYAETALSGGRDKLAERRDCRRKVKGERMIGRISQF